MNRGARPTFYLHKTNDRFVTVSREIYTLFRRERTYELCEGKEGDPSIAAILPMAK